MLEMTIDLFAGGGGASLGIEQALGVPVDLAVNHDPEALAMHKANHPETEHGCADIWSVDPISATHGRPVGLAWFSPDCRHHSRAKGGEPRDRKIRSLAWVVLRWAKAVRPRVILLENVCEFAEWSPLDKKGQPIKSKKGTIFNLWCNRLRGLGYEVQFRELRACDFGAPTIRKRLFVIARCDGEPIVWPEPTHGPLGELFGLEPYHVAAECIDWSIPCRSIFERKKPLAEKTLRRIARGIQKFVINAKEPFIVRCAHGEGAGGRWGRGEHPLTEPLPTVTGSNDFALVTPTIVSIDHSGSESGSYGATDALRTITQENRFALVSPTLIQTGYGEREGQAPRAPGLNKPLGTVVGAGKHALVAAYIQKYFGGVVGADARQPMPTVTAVDHNSLVVSHIMKFYGTNVGSDMRGPVPTITGGGQHIVEVRAFLLKYFATGVGQSLSGPLHTATSKARFGLVTIHGQDYQIVDIGLRMLTPRELARAQGFDDSYILTGTKSNQVAKIGNSVCPPVAKALVSANVKLREVSQARVGA